ncbi:hypothetical protein SASPL_112070 [Salvia splendens]|uniref:Uncharacterized protein n=1 Tax=Salvia splendens TaxID=180675 RepID=A0A8X8Y8E9_SALSN|nr:hypothetical protein SASPL_112070 [Salvia splendens]
MPHRPPRRCPRRSRFRPCPGAASEVAANFQSLTPSLVTTGVAPSEKERRHRLSLSLYAHGSAPPASSALRRAAVPTANSFWLVADFGYGLMESAGACSNLSFVLHYKKMKELLAGNGLPRHGSLLLARRPVGDKVVCGAVWLGEKNRFKTSSS